MKAFRKKGLKTIAIFTLFNIIIELIAPNMAFAVSGGPSQPELGGGGGGSLVDPFTGNFSYSIPIMNVPGPDGGYPLTLNYNSDPSTEQEASWVGLGWSLDPGSIQRDVRGVPDDFYDDDIRIERDSRPEHTYGVQIFPPLDKDGELFGIKLSESVPLLTLYRNTYRGIGYKVGASFSQQLVSVGPLSSDLSLGLGIDSQEGISVSPGLGLSSTKKASWLQFYVTPELNSRQGLKSLTFGARDTKGKSVNKGRTEVFKDGNIAGYTISYLKNLYPQVSTPIESRFAQADVKFGPNLIGAFVAVKIGGFYNVSYIGNEWKNKVYKGYGYLNLQNSDNESYIQDLVRDKDGPIHSEMTNLGIPLHSHDVYAVSGAGMGGTFRAFRNSIGRMADQKTKSRVVDGNLSLDFTTFSADQHVGVDGGGSKVKSYSSQWGEDNQTNFTHKESNENNPQFEPHYFKFQGELTTRSTTDLGYVVKDEPVRVKIETNGNNFSKKLKAKNELQALNDDGSGYTTISTQSLKPGQTREKRASVVQPIYNRELKKDAEALAHFYTEYSELDNLGSSIGNSNLSYGDNHKVGGFSVLNTSGARYIYGLPTLNTKDVECTFSVESDENNPYKKTTAFTEVGGKPNYKSGDTQRHYHRKSVEDSYAYAYRLTSVLGTDYLDTDYNKLDKSTWGPSDGDNGYWVKFGYAKKGGYRWRAPYKKANYIQGDKASPRDDMGAYSYGERDNWYVTSTETKSHIAIFSLSPRHDARGAVSELDQNSGTYGEQSYKLDKIDLYLKEEYRNKGLNAVPVKTAHFDYTYDLCGDVPNNDGQIEGSPNINTNKGKLTLKKVWFTYRGNTRGEEQPYIFDYSERDSGGTIDLVNNPNYNDVFQDRWGGYYPFSDAERTMKNPYTPQVDANNNSMKASLDEYAAVWNLREIRLPGGGTMSVTYEADDYGYVQNKPAMQMTKILATDHSEGNGYGKLEHADDKRLIWFELEHPVAEELTGEDVNQGLKDARHRREIMKYFDHTGQLCFKVKTALLGLDGSGNGNITDYITAYADIEKDENNNYECNLGGLSNGYYTTGWVRLKKVDAGRGKYNPLAVAAWQYLRTNHPELLVLSEKAMGEVGESASEAQRKAKIKSLISAYDEIKNTFVGYYNNMNNKGAGIYIDLDRSYVRLNSADRIKYGGGSRVKQIAYCDNWDLMTDGAEEKSYYGQVYDYSTEEDIDGDGEKEVISAGVASYEPVLGQEETALRYAKTWGNKRPLNTNESYTFEGPVNEAVFPTPVIGYQKVRVRSLASHYEGITVQDGDNFNIPEGILTTGTTAYDFYTAKEFPTIVKETALEHIHPRKINIYVPIVGARFFELTGASQGYSIVLNNMHGKQKRIAVFEDDKDGVTKKAPVQETTTYYKSKEKYHPALGTYFEVNNEVDVLEQLLHEESPGVYRSDIKQRIVGQDAEVIADMREHKSSTRGFGASFNVDLSFSTGFPFVVPTAIPNLGPRGNRIVKTSCINKVITKMGVPDKVVTTNRGSTISTEHVYYDKNTGNPLVDKIDNGFGSYIYSYNLPAHERYEGMGMAYETVGLHFNATVANDPLPNGHYIVTGIPSSKVDLLYEGDEFVLDAGTTAIYMGKNKNDELEFDVLDDQSQGLMTSAVDFLLVRSGRRNVLGGSYFHLASLENDQLQYTHNTCSNGVYVPVNEPIMGENPQLEALGDLYHTALIDARQQYSQFQQTGVINSNCCIGYEESVNNHIIPIFNVMIPISSSCVAAENIIFTFWSSNSLSAPWPVNPPMWKSFLNENMTSPCFNTTRNNTRPFSVFTVSETSFNRMEINPNGNLLRLRHTTTKGIIEPNLVNTGAVTCPLVVEVDNFIPKIINIQTELFESNKVLNISAQTFSDNWTIDKTNTAVNPYRSGAKGIWRPKSNYVYKATRKASKNPSSGTQPDLSQDGTFTASLFDPANPFQVECDPNWVRNSSITKVNESSFGIESKDALGNHQTSLYGYQGRFATASAVNAEEQEIAFESFEEYEKAPLSFKEQTASNFDIYWGEYTVRREAKVSSANGNLAIVDMSKADLEQFDLTKVQVSGTALRNATNHPVSGVFTIKSMKEHSSDPNKTLVEFDQVEFTLFGSTTTGEENLWRGALQLIKTGTDPGSGSPYEITSDRAHTGEKSMKLSTFDFRQYQSRLDFKLNKKYHLSTWVSMQLVAGLDRDLKYYNNHPQAVITTYDQDGVEVESITLDPIGRSIESWQQISGDFMFTQDFERVKITLKRGRNDVTYYDDLRIHPVNSSMVSSVYDFDNLRLKAILDDNNFATFYYYDQEGMLYLSKQETERGIVTLQDIVNHGADIE